MEHGPFLVSLLSCRLHLRGSFKCKDHVILFSRIGSSPTLWLALAGVVKCILVLTHLRGHTEKSFKKVTAAVLFQTQLYFVAWTFQRQAGA